jgi:hypothetical protein
MQARIVRLKQGDNALGQSVPWTTLRNIFELVKKMDALHRQESLRPATRSTGFKFLTRPISLG